MEIMKPQYMSRYNQILNKIPDFWPKFDGTDMAVLWYKLEISLLTSANNWFPFGSRLFIGSASQRIGICGA
jgi:hypothetical protein